MLCIGWKSGGREGKEWISGPLSCLPPLLLEQLVSSCTKYLVYSGLSLVLVVNVMMCCTTFSGVFHGFDL